MTPRKVPSYRLHKASGQAVVVLNGTSIKSRSREDNRNSGSGTWVRWRARGLRRRRYQCFVT